MQSVYWTRSAWSGLKGVYGISARSTRWAAARYWLHGPVTLWSASPNWWLDTLIGTMMLIPPWESITGSVWLGSPCLRMQAAHWSTRAVALPPVGDVVEVLPPLPPLPVPALVLVGRLATVGEPAT